MTVAACGDLPSTRSPTIPAVSGPVVVILAAGQGTRMRSATPKLLHPLCGRPLLWWPVAAAQAAGASKVVIVDGPGGPLAGSFGDQVETAIQEQPLGTADAVKAAAGHIDHGETVIVLAGDVPLLRPETLIELARVHEHEGAAATMLTAVLEDPRGYGRVVRAPDGTVERVVETKASGDASELELLIREVNTGVFAFDGGALLEALAHVRSDNAQGELYLPDVLPILRRHERTVLGHELPDPTETLGVNDRVALAEVRAIAQRRIHERHMLAGVTIVDPASTVIDVDVEIGADAEIEPFTSLRGTTTVGSGSVIGPNATLIDAAVGERATIVHAYVTGAEVGDRVSVGPFAYLRPGTILREGSKVGTFVEVKNSDLGAGSKIPHLSYIGDADIGEGTNLGASTITANYDGYRKHRTTIGARVKTSVDTTLVAPVKLGDDTYTAAGSVITKDIPEGALGVARAHQRNVEGYAERRREREQAARDGGPQ
ncbi:MAG: bifunctional UDP-N-acetylglucosamine pyrophosphorylase / glucosamine-phosphate N-acetyltransferase [Mucilaginibacter sp.]|nr:bifunctional UDP-N-acetylglucosamine pyrophosphorylase / glucosamine-phosphate N-acetyltransferase [Mucilaginibacter sp.]